MIQDELIPSGPPVVREATIKDYEAFWSLCYARTHRHKDDFIQMQREYEAVFTNGVPLGIVVEMAGKEESLGATLSVFIDPDFAAECKSAEHPFVRRRYLHWLNQGKRPFISPSDLRKRNRDGSLIMLWLDFGVQESDSESRKRYLLQFLLKMFEERHSGFALHEVLVEAHGSEACEMVKESGFLPINSYAAWNKQHRDSDADVVLYCANRALALNSNSYWLLRLFSSGEPRCSFTDQQRAILTIALEGQTDEDILDRLCISRNTLRDHWRKIMDHVESCYPHFLPHSPSGDVRGREKRRFVLRLIRQHPEELRPR